MADNGTLCRTLFYDISCQSRVPFAIALVDALYSYDIIAHAMASMIFQAFGVPILAVETMLSTIENMKFFLHTGFGNLASFAGGGISVKTQGLTQGNGASLAGWGVISICIVGAHGKKGHDIKFYCPITKLEHHLLAIIYVDDTNILHIDLTMDKSVEEVLQVGIVLQGLKPEPVRVTAASNDVSGCFFCRVVCPVYSAGCLDYPLVILGNGVSILFHPLQGVDSCCFVDVALQCCECGIACICKPDGIFTADDLVAGVHEDVADILSPNHEG